MDLLDYFENVCRNSVVGDVVDTRLAAAQGQWLHVQALAKRLGFEEDTSRPGVYVNRRQNHKWVLRWLRKDDFAAWQALFRVCFGHDISLTQWRWKYRDTDQPGVAVMEGERMVAFYGGMPRPILAMGQAHIGIQVGDVMVHPDFRGSLSRKGPFQMAASTFLEQSLSQGAPYWVGFGFPNKRAMQVAERLKLYRQVDEVMELAWDAKVAAMPWWLSGGPVGPQEALEQVDALWTLMQSGFRQSVLGVRDRSFMQARYAEHPTRSHEWVLVRNRFTRKACGLAVCKQESDGRLEILDLLGSPDQLRLIVAAIRHHSLATQRKSVFMWLTKSHQHVLENTGPTATPLHVSVPSNDWVPGNTDRAMDGRWWLTGGDTDFR